MKRQSATSSSSPNDYHYDDLSTSGKKTVESAKQDDIGGARGSMLNDSSFALIYQWRQLILCFFPAFLFQILIVVFASLTSYDTVWQVHLAMAFVLPFAVLIVGFMKSYVLAFLLLVTNIVLLLFDVRQLFIMVPDVLDCDSHHCNHGKKWLLMFTFISTGLFVGFLFFLNFSLLEIIKAYRNYQPPPTEPGPSKTVETDQKSGNQSDLQAGDSGAEDEEKYSGV